MDWVRHRAAERRRAALRSNALREQTGDVWNTLCSAINESVETYGSECPNDPKPSVNGKQPNTKTVKIFKNPNDPQAQTQVKLSFDKATRHIASFYGDDRRQNEPGVEFQIELIDDETVGLRCAGHNISYEDASKEILDRVLFRDLQQTP